MPDLNYERPEAMTEMKKVATFWRTQMHVDGFRLDAVKYLVENGAQVDDTPGTHKALAEYADYVRKVMPNAFTIGEVYDSTGTLLTYYPDQLDGYFAFEVADSIMTGVREGRATGMLAPVLRLQQQVPANRWSPFLRNHDQPRTISEFGGSVAKARVAATLLFMLPGFPFVYYGEELGMSGIKPDQRIRTPMAWNTTTSHAGFTSGTPWEAMQADSLSANVAALNADAGSLLNTYRTLIHLRASNAAIATGVLLPVATNNASVVAFLRVQGDERVLVVVNVSERAAIDISLTATLGTPGAGVGREFNGMNGGVPGLAAGRYELRPLFGIHAATTVIVATTAKFRHQLWSRTSRRCRPVCGR